MTANAATALIRRLGPADAEAILDVAVLCDVAEMGESDTDLDDVRQHMVAPGAQCFGVDGPQGIDAFAWVGYRAGHDSVAGDVRVRPGADPGLRKPLLATVRDVAAQIGGGRPLRLFANVNDTATQDWFASLGATSVRHFWRMEVAFGDASPPAPTVGPGVAIRPVCDNDLRSVFHVIDESFLDHYGTEGRSSYDDWLVRHGDEDRALWWLALVDGEPAAALLGKHWPGTGFVNTLGTLAPHRGRGLGRALLRTAFVEFHRRGLRRAALGVDASNPTGAVGLYESVGMRAAHAWVLYELPPPAREQPHQ
jgi:GNAT superfamily N-acetyltransferase